jgi:hypothetical protein
MLTETLTELMHRKTMWVFVAAVVVGVMGALLSTGIEASFQSNMPDDFDSDGFGDIIERPILSGFHFYIVILLFFAVMSTAGLLPSMLSPGRAEFYLSKPISHQTLLLSKLLSVFVVYGGMFLVSGLVVYLAFSVMNATFYVSVVYMMLLHVIVFGFWLTIIVFFGVLSGSTAMAMIMAFALWAAEKAMAAREFYKGLIDSDAGDFVVDGLYYLFPKGAASSDIMLDLAAGSRIADWSPLWTTGLFSLVMLLCSLWLIRRKDF